MDSMTMAILTHPYQVMLMAVVLYHALRYWLSGGSEYRVRPPAKGRSESTNRQAA